MEIRKLTEHDFDKAISLSEYAFQYKVKEEDLPKRHKLLSQQDLWGEFENGEMLAKLHIYQLQINIEEKLFPMGGIAGVATWPEHRRKGSVSRLLQKALVSMREKGQTVSLLHPFNVNFYRRFGWELTATLNKYMIEKHELFRYPDVPGNVVRLQKEEGNGPFNRVYEKWYKKYNHLLVRTEEWWNNHVFTDGYNRILYKDENGEPQGYLCCKAADKLLDVQEFIYATENARRALWNFICQHDSMVDQVKIIAPGDDQLPFLLNNPRIKQQEHYPYFMARIVDVAAFLKQYPFKEIQENTSISVTDEKAEWNNGTAYLSKDGISFEKGVSDGDLKTDIQTLTAVMLGAQKPEFLHECGKITGYPKSLTALEKIITKQPTAFLDFF
jgi:predicted acetyltransferase